MASTSVELPGSVIADYVVHENHYQGGYEKNHGNNHEEAYIGVREYDNVSIKAPYDSTHRQLRPRHIQLIGIGGTIGTTLYVQIGKGLMAGGPASLFMAFTIWYVE